jgi:hypothetical protein
MMAVAWQIVSIVAGYQLMMLVLVLQVGYAVAGHWLRGSE